MLKRVASTIFLLIFSASTLGRVIERTETWAAQQHAHISKHSPHGRTGTGIAEEPKQSARQGHTKLLEDGSVLDITFAQSSDLLPSTDTLPHGLLGFIADPNRRAVSSRAPPSFLS